LNLIYRYLIHDLFSQLKWLHLGSNEKIDDSGATMLLECINVIKELWVSSCGISSEMETKLKDYGSKVGCDVFGGKSKHHGY